MTNLYVHTIWSVWLSKSLKNPTRIIWQFFGNPAEIFHEFYGWFGPILSYSTKFIYQVGHYFLDFIFPENSLTFPCLTMFFSILSAVYIAKSYIDNSYFFRKIWKYDVYCQHLLRYLQNNLINSFSWISLTFSLEPPPPDFSLDFLMSRWAATLFMWGVYVSLFQHFIITRF